MAYISGRLVLHLATAPHPSNRRPHQVKMIKEDPSTAAYTRVWIYRNTVYG